MYARFNDEFHAPQTIKKFPSMLAMLLFLIELKNLQNHVLFRLDKPMHHPIVVQFLSVIFSSNL